MTQPGFVLFDTPIGRCGLAWSERGVAGVQLPQARESETRARLQRGFPDACESTPPPQIQRVVEDIAGLLRGELRDLSGVTLDVERVSPFCQGVYQVARSIPPGATLSYGDIAARLGMNGAARAVGQALGRNPFPIVVPCHRVLAAGGRVGGFSANGGVATKLRLLSIEKAGADRARTLFDGDGAFGFDPAAAEEHLRASDPALARLIEKVGSFRMQIDRTPNLFIALAEAIVYQQLTGKAAATIFARVRALFPRAHEGLTPRQILRASEQKLRTAGLSRSKALSLRDLAQRAVDGRLPTLAEVHRLDDEAIIERLTEVRGIGRWTAQMLLVFRLGRPDVLPVDDFGVRKGFAVACRKRGLPSPQDLEKRGKRWKPYRTVASWYLWRAAEMARK